MRAYQFLVRDLLLKTNKTIYLLALLICQSEWAFAQSTINLSDAIQKALTTNPELQIFGFREEALNAQRKVAGMRPDIELGAEADNFSGEDELEDFDGAEVTVSLSSVLELGRKRKVRKELVSEEQSVLEAEKQIASLALVGEVTRRFVAVLSAQEVVKLAEEALTLSQQTLAIVQNRAAAAAVPDAELKRAQASVVQAEIQLADERRELEYSKITLSALWGEVGSSFSSVEGDLFSFGKDIGFEELYEKVTNNPAVLVFAAQERLKQTELRLAKANSWSDISWSFGVKEFQENNSSAFVAGISVPMFASRRNSGLVAGANAEVSEAKVNKQLALLKLHTELFDVYHQRQQARLSAIQLKEKIIPALEEALKDTKQAYERGRYSYIEFVTANQELLEARYSLIQSSAQVLNYGAEIEQLTSEPLTTK